jgi:hypothetical protein
VECARQAALKQCTLTNLVKHGVPAVAKDLVNKVRAQARRQGVSSETLVNLWLQERLTSAA